MTDVFTAVNPVQGGAVGLLAIVVLMVLTGRLVPRSTLQDMRDERDTWRAAHTASEEARQLEREQVGELMEMARIGGHILTSLPYPGQAQGEVSAGGPVDQAPGPPR